MKIDELKAKQLEESKSFLRVFSTPDGERVLAVLEERFMREVVPLQPGPGLPLDAGRALFNEGARSILWWIRDEMEAAKAGGGG